MIGWPVFNGPSSGSNSRCAFGKRRGGSRLPGRYPRNLVGRELRRKSMNAKSYSSQAGRLGTVVAELHALFQRKRGDAARRRAEEILRGVRRTEREINDHYGVELKDMDVLDIGAGQMLGHLAYFARRNRAVGVDMDVIVQDFNPLNYFAMWQANGLRRVIKTLGRKLTGFDRRFRSELMRLGGWESWPRLRVLRMEADNMNFASGSFGLVHSNEVFEHVLNPAAALDEIVRVLRPGGIAYLAFQLYTGPTGALDYAGMGKAREESARWRHLRPQFQNGIDFQSALNRLRLHQWRELFAAKMPGAKFEPCHTTAPELESYARLLQSSGELMDYSLEELLTDSIVVSWKKP